jgi:transcriptional regulator with XRE-family HTH domain
LESFGDVHKKGGDILFYENYVMYCKKIGKSKTDVAKQIGKTSKSVTGWKNGAVPRNDTLKKLADYFGVTVDDLLADNKKEPAGDGGLDEQMKNIVSLLSAATKEERDAVETLLESKKRSLNDV